VITIAWNPHSFHVVDVLPKGESFNTTYYIEHIIQQILEYRPKSGCASLSFMQAMPDGIRPENLEHFASLIPSESHRILLIHKI
jgi:hypothetical protein